MMPLLSVQGLHHCFGRHRVLNGIHLALEAGNCGVLLGANGSGKSTLLALLSTRFRLQQGHYHLAGLAVAEHGDMVRSRLLFVGHHTHLYGHLTPLENLLFFADLHGLSAAGTVLREAVVAVGLEKFMEQPVRWFSAGMKKRLALARLLLFQPDLLLLDEPYSALDQQGVAWLNETISQFLQRGGVVVMASHDPERIAALPHQPFRLHRGQLYGPGEAFPC
ncbi:MAG: heme ABC exporter ATP-binding protein CcmA [Magnetococcales bacterium]|nr:heme ABC exporter ATP-binding protein CcmA [Magnetococcales bacterium]